MPFWLQLVIPAASGLVSACLGIALVPYLQKLRFFPPDQPEREQSAQEEISREERKPILGGLLLLAGIAFAMVPGIALFLQFGDADRTSSGFAAQTAQLSGACIYPTMLCAIGICSDVLLVRGRYHLKFWQNLLIPLVLTAILLTLAIINPTFSRLSDGLLWLSIIPLAVVCFGLECDLEHDTDGVLISVNAVELLVLTMLLLRRSLYMPALLTLAGAGACFGSMVWCLHPAKCRIGKTGEYLLGGILPVICLWNGMYRELALFMAAGILQQLYRLHKRENKCLTEGMAESGIQPAGRIAILAGLSAFCGLMTLLLK